MIETLSRFIVPVSLGLVLCGETLTLSDDPSLRFKNVFKIPASNRCDVFASDSGESEVTGFPVLNVGTRNSAVFWYGLRAPFPKARTVVAEIQFDEEAPVLVEMSMVERGQLFFPELSEGDHSITVLTLYASGQDKVHQVAVNRYCFSIPVAPSPMQAK